MSFHRDTQVREPHSLRAPRACPCGWGRTVTIRTGTCGPHLFTGSSPLDAGRLGYMSCSAVIMERRAPRAPLPLPALDSSSPAGPGAGHRASDDGLRRGQQGHRHSLSYTNGGQDGAFRHCFHPPPNHRYHSIETAEGDSNTEKYIFLTFSHVARLPPHTSVLFITFT